MSELVPGKLMADLATDTENTRDDDTSRSSDKEDQLKEVFANLVKVLKEQGLSSQELMDIYQGPETTPDKQFVPVEIFAGKLSPSESLCKYLKENLSLSYKEISKLINRDERSIWTSHNRAKSKMPERFPVEKLKNSRLIPISIFANRGYSVLENLVLYLKEKTGGTNYQIAKLLNKTPSMIYTIYSRAKSKTKPSLNKKTEADLAGPVEAAPKTSRKPKTSTRPTPTPKVISEKPRKRGFFGTDSRPKTKPVKRKRLNIRDYIK